MNIIKMIFNVNICTYVHCVVTKVETSGPVRAMEV